MYDQIPSINVQVYVGAATNEDVIAALKFVIGVAERDAKLLHNLNHATMKFNVAVRVDVPDTDPKPASRFSDWVRRRLGT